MSAFDNDETMQDEINSAMKQSTRYKNSPKQNSNL
jgi:hypothetical protein